MRGDQRTARYGCCCCKASRLIRFLALLLSCTWPSVMLLSRFGRRLQKGSGKLIASSFILKKTHLGIVALAPEEGGPIPTERKLGRTIAGPGTSGREEGRLFDGGSLTGLPCDPKLSSPTLEI